MMSILKALHLYNSKFKQFDSADLSLQKKDSRSGEKGKSSSPHIVFLSSGVIVIVDPSPSCLKPCQT